MKTLVPFWSAVWNLSDGVHLEPKSLTPRVMVSLVCESKVGFTIRQFTNSHRWFFTYTRVEGLDVLGKIKTTI